MRQTSTVPPLYLSLDSQQKDHPVKRIPRLSIHRWWFFLATDMPLPNIIPHFSFPYARGKSSPFISFSPYIFFSFFLFRFFPPYSLWSFFYQTFRLNGFWDCHARPGVRASFCVPSSVEISGIILLPSPRHWMMNQNVRIFFCSERTLGICIRLSFYFFFCLECVTATLKSISSGDLGEKIWKRYVDASEEIYRSAIDSR